MIRFDRLQSARRLLDHVREIAELDLTVRLWDGSLVPLKAGARTDLVLFVNAPDVITSLLRRPRLTTVIDLFAAGQLGFEGGTLLDLAARTQGTGGRAILRRLDKRLVARTVLPFLFRSAAGKAADHAFNRNASVADAAGRDKAAIQFHYDLSNDFYALFLDPEMVYSCAYFEDWETPLEAAQSAKLDMICRKLRLRPGERFLDIGCGWGGLVCHAAAHHGVSAHGVTLSEEQFAFARAKIERLGLGDRVTVELKDYRELTGEYDKIASIGMFEHVGLANRATYFAKMRDLLRPRGLLLNHAITRPAKRSRRAFSRKRPEYAAIIRYVFPGSELDNIGDSVAALERGGFEVHDVEGWREHYARTTRLWCERLYGGRVAAEREIGEAKTRLWLLYLAGVSLGFERGTIGIYQTLASKRARGPSGLPPTRADLYREKGGSD